MLGVSSKNCFLFIVDDEVKDLCEKENLKTQSVFIESRSFDLVLPQDKDSESYSKAFIPLFKPSTLSKAFI